MKNFMNLYMGVTDMLKNKELPEMSYEMRTMLFDANCKGCPYAKYKVVNTAPYTGNKKITTTSSLEEATLLISLNGRIERFCEFNDANLIEITSNSCTFWYHSEHDEGEFIEVTEFELKIKAKVYEE